MAKKRNNRRRVEEKSSSKFFLGFTGAILSIMLPVLIYAWLNDNTNTIGSQLSESNKELQSNKRILENLEGQFERKTEKGYIVKKCRDFKLNLRDPISGQVKIVRHQEKPLDIAAVDAGDQESYVLSSH